MSGKRPLDACLDFESPGPKSPPEEPLLKRRKVIGNTAIDAALVSAGSAFASQPAWIKDSAALRTPQKGKKRSFAEAMVDVKEESQEDDIFEPEIVDRGFQPGDREREVDEESTKTADTADQKLRIVIPDKFKVPVCFMCGIKANEPSPITTDNGALVAWRGYKKHFVGSELCRKPKGEKCRICTNVYCLIGFNAKHGTIDTYKKNVHAKGNNEEHGIFLDQRKAWIKEHNKKTADNVNHDQSLTRTSKQSLKRKLEVAKVASSKIRGPKRRFIESTDWDENLDGVFDKTKEVEEVLRGKTRKGIWVLVGRKGVWDAIDEDGMEVRDTTLEGDGSSSLDHAAMNNKRARIEEARLEDIEKREATAVEVKPMQLSALLALAGCEVPLASEDAAESTTALDQESSDDDIVINSDEEDESDNDNEKSRLTSYFQGSSSSVSGQNAKAKAAAGKEVKKVAVNVKAKEAKAKVNKDNQVVSVAAAGPNVAAAPAKANASNVSAKDSVNTVNTIDGRVERMTKHVETVIENVKDVLEKVEFDEDFDGLSLAGEGEKAFVEALKAKANDLTKGKTTALDAITRISRSRSQNDAFDELKTELEGLYEKLLTLLAFTYFNLKPIKDLQGAVTSFMEIVEMGYALTKPYLLRLVDAHFHLNLVNQNDEEVCSMIQSTSELHAMLLRGLSLEEIQEIFISKVEQTLVDLLTRFVKQIKTSQQKSDLRKSMIERLNTYSRATASGQDFKTVHTATRYGILFVDPVKAPPKELADARYVFEAMIAGKAPTHGDGVPSAVFSFFLGAGNALYEEASVILSYRAQEIKNQDELEGITAAVLAHEAALGEERCSVCLMQKCHLLLYTIADVMGRKKNDIQYYTHEQQLVLRKHKERFIGSIQANMKPFLRGSIGHALRLFKMAIDGKGYIDAKYLENNDVLLGIGEETELSGEETELSGLKGAIEKAILRNYLVPVEVHSKDFPKTISSIAATLMDPGLALTVLDVMCALLSKTEAWAVFDKEEVKIDRDSLSSVKPALIVLGVKSEMAEKFWQETILDPYLSQVESHSGQFMSSLQHRMKECFDGNYANLKPAITAALLSGFPGKKELKKHLDMFFKGAAKYADILTRGSLSKPPKIRETLADMRHLEENLTAFGQELREMGTFGEGLREESLEEFVKNVIKKLEALQQGTMSKTHNDLKKAHGLAKTLVDAVDTADSKKICEYMRKESSKLSGKQVGLREKMKMMEKEDPNIAQKAKKDAVLDQGPVSSYKEASKLDNEITQLICVYVALQIGGSHSAAKPQTQALASAFATLDKAIEDAGGEALKIFPDEVAKLRKEISNPGAEENITGTQTASEPGGRKF